MKENKRFKYIISLPSIVEIMDNKNINSLRKLEVKTKNKRLLELAGVWKKNSDMPKIMKKVYSDRKNFKLRN